MLAEYIGHYDAAGVIEINMIYFDRGTHDQDRTDDPHRLEVLSSSSRMRFITAPDGGA
jgi:hypothetical protein